MTDAVTDPSSPPIPKRTGWLFLPVKALSIPSGLVALYYGTFTLQTPPGALAKLLALTALAIGLVELERVRHQRSRLGALRRIEGQRSPAKPDLLAAIREVLSIPEGFVRREMLLWGSATSFVALGMRLWGSNPSWLFSAQIAFVGVLFGPLVGTLCHGVIVARSRRLALELSRFGVTPEELLAALPRTRYSLRLRLSATMATLLLVPSVLSAQVAMAIADRQIELARQGTRAEFAAAAERLYGQILGSGTILFAFVGAIALAIVWFAATNLAGPLGLLARSGKRMGEGDLGASQLVLADHEVWTLSVAYQRMRARLRETLQPMQAAGLRLSSTTAQLSTNVDGQRAGAAEQASALTETSATTEELARSASQISENASEVTALAQQTLAAARAGQRTSEAFLLAIAGMQSQRQKIADAVLSLNDRVQRVGRIVEFINGISDKSDLLALNAELEGTKAGEIGRGFSLVAAEMRRLAENTLRSTQEISRLIHEIRDASQVAVLTTEGGLRVTEQAGEMAQGISSKLGQILELAEQTTGQIEAIRTSTNQQQAGTDQLAIAMEQVLKVTEEATTESSRIEAASLALTGISTALARAVEGFRLDGRGGAR